MSRRNQVTVESVSPSYRSGPLEGVLYAVAERTWRDSRWVLVAWHLPGTAEERATSLLDFGQKVAAEEGALWVQPGPWVPGVADDFSDVAEDGNGLVRNRHARRYPKPQRAGVSA